MTWLEAARKNHQEAKARYARVAPLFAKIQVQPQLIVRACRMHMFTRAEFGSKLFDMGRIAGGEWDHTYGGADNPVIAEDPVIVAMRLRFQDHVSWAETGVIEHKLLQIDRSRKGVIDGCRTRLDLERRYDALDGVAASIAKDGYRSSNDLERRRRGGFDDISVSIGRDGELLLATGGLHRLGILLALNHKIIPSYVISRHDAWQNTREAATKAARLRHPDLLDL